MKAFIFGPLFDASGLPFLLISPLLLWTISVQGWKDCYGGGVCPDYATCCPSTIPGIPPTCISTRHGKDPLNATGQCCDETTGCPYGFSCAFRNISIIIDDDDTANHQTRQEQPYCKIDEANPPADLFHDQPRYQMCRIPDSFMTIMHGFPIAPSSKNEPKHPKSQRIRQQLAMYRLAYYSSHGDLQCLKGENCKGTIHSTANPIDIDVNKIQKVVIMIHGSQRSAEDYFCVALSLVPDEERDSVLVIAPKFLAPTDLHGENKTNFLVWQEDKDPPKYPMAHSWRYGADALNAAISSYEAIDRLVQNLVATIPSLKYVVVAGHSAGGQVAHRWALLSKEPSGAVRARAVVANPRSYCYLNGKRMVAHHNLTSWEYPSAEQIHQCPVYNQWNWGLDAHGALDPVVPYKVQRLNETTPEKLAQEYFSRKVYYLTGEYDVIEQNDQCATYKLQGKNRHERALHYFDSLRRESHEKKKRLNHELYTIPESPHDHVLMFQSSAARRAIFSDSADETLPTKEEAILTSK